MQKRTLVIGTAAAAAAAAANSFAAAAASKPPFDTIFAQGGPNPYGKFFTGQTYLTMLSEGGAP